MGKDCNGKEVEENGCCRSFEMFCNVYCNYFQVEVLKCVAQHPQVTGLSGLHHCDRGQAARGAQHGSRRLRPGVVFSKLLKNLKERNFVLMDVIVYPTPNVLNFCRLEMPRSGLRLKNQQIAPITTRLKCYE